MLSRSLRARTGCFFICHGAPAAATTAAAPAHAATTPAALAGGTSESVPQALYAVCWGWQTGNSHVAYFNDPYEVSVPNAAARMKAYREVLKAKYQFTGPIHCPAFKSLADAQKYSQAQADPLRASMKIVTTNWKDQ